MSGVDEREDVVVGGAWGDGVRVGGLGLLDGPKESRRGDAGRWGTGATTGGGVGILGGDVGGLGADVDVDRVGCLLGARDGTREGGLTADGAGVLNPVWGAGFSGVPESHWFVSTNREDEIRSGVSGYALPCLSVRYIQPYVSCHRIYLLPRRRVPESWSSESVGGRFLSWRFLCGGATVYDA